MTRQDVNAIILGHLDQELRDQPSVAERVGTAFNAWFQGLVAPLPPAPPPPEEEKA